MQRKRKLRKHQARRLHSTRFRRILKIYRLKRRISNRHRIGFVILQQKPY